MEESGGFGISPHFHPKTNLNHSKIVKKIIVSRALKYNH